MHLSRKYSDQVRDPACLSLEMKGVIAQALETHAAEPIVLTAHRVRLAGSLKSLYGSN